MSNITEEAAIELLEAQNEFLEKIGHTAVAHNLEDEMGPILITAMQRMVEHSVTKDEDIVEFVNQFVEVTQEAYKEGRLEAKAQFKNPEEARDAWKEKYQ